MKSMNFYIIFLFLVAIFTISDISYAATVGNPLDLDVPARSGILRQQVIDDTMDEYEEAFKLKASFDAEFVLDKDLRTSFEMQGAELEGNWNMTKIGATFFNKVEPYIKLGTSSLEVKWKQNSENIEVEADDGFAWGGGVKMVLWDFDNWGIRLTGDAQYRISEPDASQVLRGSTTVNDTGAVFKIEEYQASLALSKKFELPLKWQSIYVVPYTGISISDSTVDVSFKDPNAPGADFSLFDASNDSAAGLFIGCDIMPNLMSSFIYSIEARFLNEIALTFGGTLKF